MTWPTFNDEALFRSWVSARSAQGPGVHVDLASLYAKYGVTPKVDGRMTMREVVEHLSHLIVAALSAGTGPGASELTTLRDHLIMRNVLDGQTLHPFVNVACLLADALRAKGTFVGFEDAASWQRAVTLAQDQLELQPALALDDRALRRIFGRQYVVAETAHFLRSIGLIVGVEAGHIAMSDAERSKVADGLRLRIRKLGGLATALCIFRTLSPFDPKLERYHLVRRVSTAPQASPPQVPYGYLLNLCVREAHVYADGEIDAAETEALMGELFLMATALTAIMDVQPYSSFELMFVDPAKLGTKLIQIAVYDSTFTLVQQRPSDVMTILRGVFAWVSDNESLDRCGWPISAALAVVEEIARLCRPTEPLTFRAKEICDAVPSCPREQIESILSALTHSTGDVNKEFHLPTDITKLDFAFKPLLMMRDGTYILLDPSWCSPSFYEALAAALRKAGVPQVQERMGDAAEALIRSALERHGIQPVHGDYNSGGAHGECDVVVETDTQLLFMEAKGKALTREARSGSDVGLISDLTASFLKAQAQAGGHEVLLRRHGHLELVSHEQTYRLEHGRRQVQRIAITLLDFGALQDRHFSQQFMQAALQVQIVAIDPAMDERLGSFRKRQDELRLQYTDLATLSSDMAKNPMTNLWFLSVPALLVLLDGVSSADDFQRSLFKTRFVTFGSHDFYFELSNAGGLGLATTPADS